jgi:hypothetical protein
MGCYCNFRHPKTTNEMRQYFSSLENELNISVKVRGQRRVKSLPHSWFDIDKPSIHNWKQYRKNQFRQKKRQV